MTTTENTAKITRTAKFAGFTLTEGTEVEIRGAHLDRNGLPMVTVVVVADGRRCQLPSDFFPKGALRGIVASELSR